MSTQKKKKIASTQLKDSDLKTIESINELSGAIESVILRGLIRFGIGEFKKKKISVLEIVRIGAY